MAFFLKLLFQIFSKFKHFLAKIKFTLPLFILSFRYSYFYFPNFTLYLILFIPLPKWMVTTYTAQASTFKLLHLYFFFCLSHSVICHVLRVTSLILFLLSFFICLLSLLFRHASLSVTRHTLHLSSLIFNLKS